MKTSIKIKYINARLLLNGLKRLFYLAFFITLNIPSYGQQEFYCTQDHYKDLLYPVRSHTTDTTLNVNPNDTSWAHILKMYAPCPNRDSNLRAIGFIHGLGGSIGSWDKQITFTTDFFHTASFGVEYTSSSYEVSPDAVIRKINLDLANGLEEVDEYYFDNFGGTRCISDDYVITHSQGGIMARYLDYKWQYDQTGTFGNRKYGGIVTFGTSHAGADVALTKDEHYAFVAEVIKSIYLKELDELIFDLTDGFLGTFIGDKVYALDKRLDTLIKNELAPLMLSSVHRPTLDSIAPGTDFMNRINGFYGNQHRVAFYGIEDAPECWRVLDMVVTKGAEEYPIWGANKDEVFMNRMEAVRGDHELEIERAANRIKRLSTNIRATAGISAIWNNKRIKNIEKNIQLRNERIDFLNSANTYWRFLIGSYHRDSAIMTLVPVFTVTYQIQFYSFIDKAYFSTWHTLNFNDLATAEYYARVFNGTMTSKYELKKSYVFYPSDGVVLARSQVAFPGIKAQNIDYMPHNNHFQERNSRETERVMKNLYTGFFYDDYFILKK